VPLLHRAGRELRGIIPIRGGLAAVECAAIVQGTSPLRPEQVCIVNTDDGEGGTEADFDFGADWKVACKILGTGLTLAQITALTLGVAGIAYILSLLP
jgi:hypothetical protein